MLNGTVARKDRAVVDSQNVAFYLHVDDGLIITDNDDLSTKLMHASADALEKVGFVVEDRQTPDMLAKIVGYQVRRSPPGLCFPAEKARHLRSGMLWLCSCSKVDVSMVQSLLGVWIFGALLRRELLSAANHVFTSV